ncbi:GTPase Era [Alphaproteobacteria bacterium]|nr:GTPase Era [Alphaproteobacteria bacterium]GHS97757.1 GTPase Era [Alphaproteobacteria bacterium]
MAQQKFGFVALCGAPNAGKSTLLNALVGKSVAAVSAKPQTTRFNVLSVLEQESAQIAFVDTPGLFTPTTEFGKILRKNSFQAIKSADIIVMVADLSAKNMKASHEIIHMLLQRYSERGPVLFLAFNKVDKVKENDLLAKTAEFKAYTRFDDFFILSAEKKTNVPILRHSLQERLPEGPWLYPPQSVLPDLARWAAEMTMEHVFQNLQEEIPYQAYVEPVALQEDEDGLHIFQNIVVAKESQKPIVIGQKGQRLKTIGMNARLKIAKGLKRRVHLHLRVKVCPDWMAQPHYLKEAGVEASSAL